MSEQTMQFHEVANLFPLIEGKEFDDLVADIRENGLQQPIWTYQGKIIDGRNRYRACIKADVEPRFQEWDGNGSLVAFAISLNVKRRHLTSSQLSVIALEVERQLATEAKGRQRVAGGDKKSEEARSLPQNSGEAIHKEAAKEAANLLGTNHDYVSAAKKIQHDAPELLEHVMNGTLTTPDAKAIASLPKKRREKVVKKAMAKKEEEGKRVSKAVKEAIAEEEVAQKQEELAQLEQVASSPASADVKEPIQVKPGQVWRLGRHLLYCGDSASSQFIALAQLSEPSFAFADPPYNAGVAEWDNGFEWRHDYLIDVAPIAAVTPGIASIQSFMRTTSMPYQWSLSYWLDNGMTRGALGFGNWMYVALFTHGSLYRNAQDFERVSISSNDRDELQHKGRKPLAMLLHLAKTFTNEGDVILDPFLGTGTTLIVCEQTNRACVGAEINPDYCASIIRRWEGITKGTAEIVEEVSDVENAALV